MTDYESLNFPVLSDRPYVICNMVMTADGKATIDGTAHGIGGTKDHQFMQELRLHADALLSGAGTLIKEDIVPFLDEKYQQLRVDHGKPARPRAITLTDRGPLPYGKKFFAAENRPTVFFYGDDDKGIAEHAQLIKLKDPILPDMLERAKKDLGIDLLLLEGGPRLNHALLEVGLVDELFVTLAPAISGLSGITIVEGPRFLGLDLQLVSTIQYNNELFLRYKINQK